jgi:hypothetical protein|tara:strand:+ start:1003 stop:1827 length:825 start_codon:yes stop_codon:yes gene_type:complete
MIVNKLKLGDRIQFAKDTFAWLNRNDFQVDISHLKGTVENFSQSLDGSHIWIKLEKPHKELNDDEYGNCVQFNLDNYSFGGACVKDLQRAKLIKKSEDNVKRDNAYVEYKKLKRDLIKGEYPNLKIGNTPLKDLVKYTYEDRLGIYAVLSDPFYPKGTNWSSYQVECCLAMKTRDTRRIIQDLNCFLTFNDFDYRLGEYKKLVPLEELHSDKSYEPFFCVENHEGISHGDLKVIEKKFNVKFGTDYKYYEIEETDLRLTFHSGIEIGCHSKPRR